MNAAIGCYSTSPDREYDAVVIDLGSLFVRELENRRTAFDRALKLDDALCAHEYRCNRVALAEFKYDGPLSNPVGLVLFSTALAERDEREHELISPEIPFLVVVKEGFFFEFDADDSWGNTISYFTDTSTLGDVRTLQPT